MLRAISASYLPTAVLCGFLPHFVIHGCCQDGNLGPAGQVVELLSHLGCNSMSPKIEKAAEATAVMTNHSCNEINFLLHPLH